MRKRVTQLGRRIGAHPGALGAVVVGAGILLCVLVFGGFTRSWFEPHGPTYRATFTDAGMLAKGAPVRVRGVTQGRVKRLSLNPDGRTSTVEFELYEDSLPLYRDATAAVKFRNALGGNDAVVIDRGTPAKGVLPGRAIPVAQTSGQVEVDQILAALRGRERAGLATMLHELPTAFADRDQLARGLATLTTASPRLAKGLAALRGERDGDLRRLLANVDSTVDALDDNPAGLADVLEGGASTFATTAARSGDLQATIERSAKLLPGVRTTLHTLDGTLGRADRLLARLRGPSAAVAPSLRALRPAVLDTRALLRGARPLLADLRPAAGSLARAGRAGRPLLDRLEPSIQRVDDHILPDLGKPDPTTGRATYQMIGPTLSGLGSASANVDQNAHFVTLGAGGGERIVSTAPCRTYFTDPSAKQIADCEGLAEALDAYLSWHPLPRGKGRTR